MSDGSTSIPEHSTRWRFCRVMQFQSVERVPNCELGPWPQTLQRWYEEGMVMRLPSGSCWNGQPAFGLEPLYVGAGAVNTGLIPIFEVKVIEETDRYIIARDGRGIVTKALKTGYVNGQRLSMDQYLEFPVKNRADFEALRERLDPDDPTRCPGLLKDSRTRTVPLVAPGSVGLYMKLREWMGTENLSIAFYEQPDLIHDMLDFLVDFHLRIADRVSDRIEADLYVFSEDLACKNGPLFSPRMFEEFFACRYKKIVNYMRKKGIGIFMLESDGNFERILPQLIECGINATIPVEAAADMDPVKLRKEYGKEIALVGGIDKRCIAAGKEEIKRELETKLPQLLEAGGYLPTIDGDLAPDIPLDNFYYYLELKNSYLS